MSRKKPRKNLEECPKQKNYQKRIEDLRAEEIVLKKLSSKKNFGNNYIEIPENLRQKTGENLKNLSGKTS